MVRTRIRLKPPRISRTTRVLLLSAVVCGGAANSAQAAAPPASATTAIHDLFAADANAQVVDSPQAGVSLPALSSAAAASLSALVTRDASAAKSTASQGFAWDSSTTSLTDASVLSEAAGAIQVSVNVKDIFHIAGTPNDGSLDNESITIDPYTVNLSQGPDGSWQVVQFTLQPSGDTPGPTPPGLAPQAAPPGSSSAPSLLPSVARTAKVHSTRSRTPRAHAAGGTYSVANAVAYAKQWWNGYSPQYRRFGNDCQNFVSQILYHGGVAYDVFGSWRPYYYPWINVGWFNNWAFTDAPMVLLKAVNNAKAGDVLQIAWQGGFTPKHTFFVDASRNGMPLLAGHTNARWNYPVATVAAQFPHATWWAFHPYGATRY